MFYIKERSIPSLFFTEEGILETSFTLQGKNSKREKRKKNEGKGAIQSQVRVVTSTDILHVEPTPPLSGNHYKSTRRHLSHSEKV